LAALLKKGWRRRHRQSLLLEEEGEPAPRHATPLGGYAWPQPEPVAHPGLVPPPPGAQPWPPQAAYPTEPIRHILVAQPPAPAAAAPVPVDADAIRATLAAINGTAQKCAGLFYGKLFREHPDWRFDLFPPMMNEQNEKLFDALTKIGDWADRPDQLGQYARQLGKDHLARGVTPEMYPDVGTALLKTLAERDPGWDDRREAAWLAAYGLLAGLMIDGAEDTEGPPFWHGRVAGHRLVGRDQDIAVLDIELLEDYPHPYEPGQYAYVMHPKWDRVWRPYSIAAPPAPGGRRIVLHVRRVSGGWVSTALNRDIPADGAALLIGPPMGQMTADQAGGSGPVLLVGGGVGAAPLLALAPDMLARAGAAAAGGWGRHREVNLVWAAGNPLDLHAWPEVREWELTWPWFHAERVIDGVDGGVAEAIQRTCPFPDHAMIAGPPGMITTVTRALGEAGVPRDCLHFDDLGVS
jgi:NAD(P)H-flavin reductase